MKELLRLRDVSKFYNTTSVALGLRHVNATFMKGEFVAITGESGSGKSTLLNVLSGLDTYEEGELFINGEESSYFSEIEREIYRKEYISFVFQDYNIIDSYTVFQNVELALFDSMPDKAQRKARVLEILKSVGLLEHRTHRGTKLSGGQKQRVSIARALAKDAPILFADEPTGNLDSATSIEIMELLDRLSRNKLVIVVTHNYEDVEKYATRRLRLFDGEVIEDKQIGTDGHGSAEVLERRELNGLNGEFEGYAVIEKPTIGELAEDVLDAGNKPDSKDARKIKREQTMQRIKTMLNICRNNLVATPKVTLFILTGFVLLSVCVFYVCINYLEGEDPGEGSLMGAARNEFIITKDTPFTEADIDAIEEVNGVMAVTAYQPSSLGYNMQVVQDFSNNLRYKESFYNLDYQMLKVSSQALLKAKPDGGKMPTNDNEILICIDSGEVTNTVIGMQITLDSNSISGVRDFNKTYTVTGYIYPSERNDYDTWVVYLPHGDYLSCEAEVVMILHTSYDINVISTDYSQRCVTMDSGDNYRSIAATLQDMGYRTYYPYGLQSRNITLDGVTSTLTLIGLLILVLVVMAIVGNSVKRVMAVKNKDYNIMKTVGVSSGMIGNMFYAEMGVLATLSYLISGIIVCLIKAITLIIAKVNGSNVTGALVAQSFNLWRPFILGIFVMIVMMILIVGRFKKKMRASSIKTSMTTGGIQ